MKKEKTLAGSRLGDPDEALKKHCKAANRLFDNSFAVELAEETRTNYQKPVDLTLQIGHGDIHLLKSHFIKPPTDERERKYINEIKKLSEEELSIFLVKLAVRQVAGEYARSLISPSV